MSKFMISIQLFVVALFLASTTSTFGQSLDNELRNIEKRINHLRDAQSRCDRQLQVLQDGTAIFSSISRDNPVRVLLTITTVREHARQAFILRESMKPNPNFDNIDKEVEGIVSRILRAWQPIVKNDITRLRTEKKNLETALARALKRQDEIRAQMRNSGSETTELDPAGTWRRDSDGYTVTLSGSGKKYTGTIASLPQYLANAGFKVGELVWEFDRSGPHTFKGKAKGRSGGTEFWVAIDFTMTDSNHITASDGSKLTRGKS